MAQRWSRPKVSAHLLGSAPCNQHEEGHRPWPLLQPPRLYQDRPRAHSGRTGDAGIHFGTEGAFTAADGADDGGRPGLWRMGPRVQTMRKENLQREKTAKIPEPGPDR